MTIAHQLQALRKTIAEVCQQAERDPATVQLLAVSKNFPAESVREAFAAGQTVFGENYVQEALDKMTALADLPLQWHLIGPLQSNKTRVVAEHFDWVHTVDRLKIAERLSEQRPAQLAPLQICLQVNINDGPTKAGIPADEVVELAQAISQLPRLQLRGLMRIPEPAATFDEQLAIHQQTRDLLQRLQAQGLEVDTLSMGMSADWQAAVYAGSTLLRLGTAIFGQRMK